jgi:uncharacterized membrane protein YbhN (UPF0104 family)
VKRFGSVRLWVSLASAGFLLASLLSNGRQMAQLSLDLQGWFWLLLGLGISLLSLMVNGLAWGVVLRWLGHRPQWLAVMLLFLSSNLRKYLPGGIWHLHQRLRALQRQSHPLSGPQALLAVLLDPVLMAVAALSLVPWGGWQGGLALLCLLPLVLLLPRLLNPLMERLERSKAQQLLEGGGVSAAPGNLQLAGYPWQPLLAELAFVLLRFAGFACCVQAFELAFHLGWGAWMAGFALAWTAGLVVPAAPGGLGVFETVLVLRLAGTVPEAPLLALALSYRVVVSLADLVAAASARADLARLRNSRYC